MTEPKDLKCNFDEAWVGHCQNPATPYGRCERHRRLCDVCGQVAIRSCDHTGIQFVCGVPLCAACEGFVDETKPSGLFALGNHGHRRKASVVREGEPA